MHINIGGGSEDSIKKRLGDLEGMANITFAWMVDRCQPFLDFNPMSMIGIIRNYSLMSNEVLAEEKKKGMKSRDIGWGTGPFLDSYEGIEDTAAGQECRRPGAYYKGHLTRECFHPVVQHLLEQGRGDDGFHPEVLEGFSREENEPKGGGNGYTWRKTYKPVSLWVHQRLWNFLSRKVVWSGKEELAVEIPEFVIPREIFKPGVKGGQKPFHVEREWIKFCCDGWREGLSKEQQELEKSIKRDHKAEQFIQKLDKANRNCPGF